MPRLLALFVIVPAVELYLLIQLGAMIGALETFGIIVATGIIGSYLAKSQGTAILRRFQEKLASGQAPGKELADGAIILVSGAFLLTPGVLTDFVGLLGLFPLTRPLIRKWLQPWISRLLENKIAQGNIHVARWPNNTSTAPPSNGNTINTESEPDTGPIVGGRGVHKPGQAG